MWTFAFFENHVNRVMQKMTPANDNHLPRLMTPAEAATATTFSRAMLAIMSAEGNFPRPVRIGERRLAYVRAEVDAWIDKAIAQRSA